MSAVTGFIRTAVASAEARVVVWTGVLAACASLSALLTARWLGATEFIGDGYICRLYAVLGCVALR